MKRYTRKEVTDRLNAVIARKDSILIAGCGCGESARQCEKGGADLIGVYTSSFFRMEGIYAIPQWLPLINNNKKVLELLTEVSAVIDSVPLIAGVMSNDPTLDYEEYIGKLKAAGCSCYMSFPTISWHEGRVRKAADEAGIGFPRELEIARLAREMDLFSIGYAFNAEDAVATAASGMDLLILHMGRTIGGATGDAKQTKLTVEDAIEKINEWYDMAKAANPDVMIFAHGGPISNPDDVEQMFRHTKVTGFLGASSCERIPIEKPQENFIRDVKALKIRASL